MALLDLNDILDSFVFQLREKEYSDDQIESALAVKSFSLLYKQIGDAEQVMLRAIHRSIIWRDTVNAHFKENPEDDSDV